MSPHPLSRAVSSILCVALAAAAPGLPSYAAAAGVVRLHATAPQGPAMTALPVLGPGAGPASVPGVSVSNLGLTSLLDVSAAPTIMPPSASPAALSAARPAAAVAAPRVSPAAALQPVTQEVSAALESVGELGSASPSSMSGLGRRLEAALTGAPAPASSGDLTAPISDPMGELVPHGGQFARPAGDLIRQAAEAEKVTPAAAPPSVEKQPSSPAPRGDDAPFWPKLIASGLAVAPAAFLSWPLLAAGSILMGGLVLASSLALTLMPFLDESSPKILRALPGLAVAGLGVAALASGLYWPGAFAAVGGWALARYGLGKSEAPEHGSLGSLSAYFGGVAALTLVSLAAATPAGWLAAALPYAAYPVASLLWLHLPSWVGSGFMSALLTIPVSARGLVRVMTAVHRDTVLLERLTKFSERHWNQSRWNGVWLAVMWTPIVLFEALKWLAGAALGVYVAAVQAPVNFLWGASFKLFPRSKAVVYLAEASRFVFDNLQNGKAARFNPFETKFLPLANSPVFVRRVLGSLALTALQLGWAAYAVLGAPLLSLAGLMTAFRRLGVTYDENRHAPSSRRLNTKDSPGDKPTEPTDPPPAEPGKPPLAPKLIATALALVPAVYFGLPLVAAFSLKTLLYASLVLPLAAMPFMGPRTPSFLKSLPGNALGWNGLVLLVSGHAILAGLIALLGGWGFERYIASLDDDDNEKHRFDAELGAFFGALGSAVAVGAAWMGLTGPWGWAALGFAGVTSPLLLRHLPQWVFSGIRGAFRPVSKAIDAWHWGISFWSNDTKFIHHLLDHARYWLNKSYWNGVWLSVIWVPTGLVVAAEFLLAAVLGVLTGLLRAPLGILEGAYQEARPAGKAVIFFREATAGWLASAEGSKTVLDKMVGPFKAAMNETAPVSGRPTLKAVGALFLARLTQLLWLAGVVLMLGSGAALVVGLVRGVQAARAPQK